MLTLLIIHCIGQSSFGLVDVYPGPDEQYRSLKYRVSISQAGETYESFVYQDQNQFTDLMDDMTDFNHFTTFSFDEPIRVEVVKLTGDVGACTVYPLRLGIRPEVTGDRIAFSLPIPVKIYLKLEGEYEHPLFIFADPPEENAPRPGDENVVYWGPGVHDIGTNYALENDRTYYLAGGAYVRGSLRGGSSNVTIRGRGVLSGENIQHCPYSSCGSDRVAIHFDGNGSQNLVIEGITVIKPGLYCIRSYGGQLVTSNVKCFGWWYETDGWVGGNGSILEDSFFKVNDDVVKMYFDDVQVRNCVIYHQLNGAPFQLGWNPTDGSEGLVENIDVVADEVIYSRDFSSNRSFLNRARMNDGRNDNFTFRNIRFDQDVSSVIGVITSGTLKNIHFQNVTVEGRQRFNSYLEGGEISNIHFENLIIGGEFILEAEGIGLQTRGSVTDVRFTRNDAIAVQPMQTFRIDRNSRLLRIRTGEDLSLQDFSGNNRWRLVAQNGRILMDCFRNRCTGSVPHTGIYIVHEPEMQRREACPRW